MEFPILKNAKNLAGKRVLLRVDFNVPIEGGKALDDFRIRKALPTIKYLGEQGARVIVISHHSNSKQTLAPVALQLSRFLRASFVEDVFTTSASANENAVVLCENLRFWNGEKENDEDFAKRLASLGDVFVNNAFSASHREHASIVSLPRILPSYAGLLFEKEVENLSRAFNPPHPFLFILGGAKAGTKLPLVEKFLEHADYVFIGGALANNLFLTLGHEIGHSLFEEAMVDARRLLKSEKIVVPTDVVVQGDKGIETKATDEVAASDMVLDAGPKTLARLRELTQNSQFILWNGPIGDYEKAEFGKGTAELIEMLAESGAYTVAGGGDTAAAIAKAGAEEKFDFISTGGGAMLEFLAKKTLPGIEALRTSMRG